MAHYYYYNDAKDPHLRIIIGKESIMHQYAHLKKREPTHEWHLTILGYNNLTVESIN